MTRVRLVIPDGVLAEIDVHAGGDRTGFIVGAALERIHRLRRDALDDDVRSSLERDARADARDFGAWTATMGDGLD